MQNKVRNWKRVKLHLADTLKHKQRQNLRGLTTCTNASWVTSRDVEDGVEIPSLTLVQGQLHGCFDHSCKRQGSLYFPFKHPPAWPGTCGFDPSGEGRDPGRRGVVATQREHHLDSKPGLSGPQRVLLNAPGVSMCDLLEGTHFRLAEKGIPKVTKVSAMLRVPL